jgi:hypothetical protein
VLFFVVLFLVRDPRLDRVVVVLLVLLAGAAAGSLMVLQGRRRGGLVLTVSAVGVLVALGMLALVLAALGVGYGMWVAALLAVGPVGCLVLSPRRSVRRWTHSAATGRSAGGRRSAASSG